MSDILESELYDTLYLWASRFRDAGATFPEDLLKTALNLLREGKIGEEDVWFFSDISSAIDPLQLFHGQSSIAIWNLQKEGDERKDLGGVYELFSRISLAQHTANLLYQLERVISNPTGSVRVPAGGYYTFSHSDFVDLFIGAVVHDVGKSEFLLEELGEDHAYRKVDHANLSADWFLSITSDIGDYRKRIERIASAVRSHHSQVSRSQRMEFELRALDQMARAKELEELEKAGVKAGVERGTWKKIEREDLRGEVPSEVMEKVISYMLEKGSDFTYRNGKRHFAFFVFGSVLYVDAFYMIDILQKYGVAGLRSGDVRSVIPTINTLRAMRRLPQELRGNLPWWYEVRFRNGARGRMLTIPILLSPEEASWVRPHEWVVEVRYSSPAKETASTTPHRRSVFL